MNALTNVLYWISTGLLLPVIILLIAVFVIALLMLGGFYGRYMQRLKFKQSMDEVLIKLRDQSDHSQLSETIKGSASFIASIKLAEKMNWDAIHTDKILADFELAGEKELETSKTLMRIGPMLGLMGRLTPMGPA